MGNYAVEMNRTASTTLPVGSVTADATRPRRLRIFGIWFGSEATPADNAFLLRIQRVTAAGTSTGVTPTALDPADAATEFDAGENHTVDATATAGAILLSVAINQKNTLQFYTTKGGLYTPATASNGAALYTPTATALVVVTATLHVEEQ